MHVNKTRFNLNSAHSRRSPKQNGSERPITCKSTRSSTASYSASCKLHRSFAWTCTAPDWPWYLKRSDWPCCRSLEFTFLGLVKIYSQVVFAPLWSIYDVVVSYAMGLSADLDRVQFGTLYSPVPKQVQFCTIYVQRLIVCLI